MTCQIADGLRARIWETSTQLAYPQVAQIDGFSTSRQQAGRFPTAEEILEYA
jgi:hypothetical protein